MKKNHRGAKFFPLNTFALKIEHFVEKNLKQYGIRTPKVTKSPGLFLYPIALASAGFIVLFGNYFFNLGPRSLYRMRQERKEFPKFVKENDLPSKFNPLQDESHIDHFTKQRALIIKKKLGPEIREQYNPFSPQYYLHTLPPKDPKENLLWMKKSRNWSDYRKWLQDKHPKEYANLQNGEYFIK